MLNQAQKVASLGVNGASCTNFISKLLGDLPVMLSIATAPRQMVNDDSKIPVNDVTSC